LKEDTMAAKKKDPKPKKPKGNGHTPKRTVKADVKIEHFNRSLRCELSEGEVNERAKRITRLLSQKAQRQEAAKAATAHLKAEIKEFDAEIGKLAREVDDSACYRDVPCERRFIYRTGKVEEIRLDSKEMIYERAMDGEERQLELPKKKTKPVSQDETTKAPETFTEKVQAAADALTEAGAELATDVDDDPDDADGEQPGDTAE
jgi:hypothetical protein